jgi:hypothetical protein
MTPDSDGSGRPTTVSPARHEDQWLAKRERPPAASGRPWPVTMPDDAQAIADLEPLQRELLGEEARALREAVSDPERRVRYEELAAAVEGGIVPAHRVAAVESLLELGLETGRFRSRYTAEGEQALLALYRRTPRGAAVQRSVAVTNEALRALRGRSLQDVAFASKGPRAYGLTLTTDSGRVSLTIDRGGVWVESVEVEA